MAVTRAVIDVDINTSGAAASLRSLQSQVNAFNSSLNRGNIAHAAAAKSYSESLTQLVNTTGYFTAETVKMQTAATRLDDTLRKGKGGIGQYFNSLKRGTTEYAQVTSLAHARAAALQTQFVATAGAANGYREAIAIRPIHAFNDATSVSNQRLAIQRAMFNQATTSMINFGKNTQWAGRQLMVGFTVPLTIFGTLAGKTFMDLEKAAISFKKVYGDAFTTPEELQTNLDAVKKLSAEFTKYGIAAKDTMEMAAQAAAAGAQNADLIDATTESTRLATLGQMEQQKALEATISLQNAFGLSSDKLTKSINFMNMVENQTVLTLQDMADAIPRVAPVIKGLGGTVEDMAAMLAAMKEGGVSAAQGANALKSGLASLINPTNRAVESLGKMGINLNSIIQSNRGDLMGTVQDFATELAKLDKLSQQQVLENVFGKYQYARLGALFKNIIKDGTQASRVLEMAGMSAQQMAATAEKELGIIAESPATKFTAAIERMKLAIAPIGEIFVRVATPIIEIFTRLLDTFNGLPDGVKKIGAIGTIIVGVLIPAGTMFLGLLMNLTGTLLKFGNIMKLAFSGFAKGGIKGAIESVNQSLRYMSLAEMDTAQAARQLGDSTTAVSSAFRSQVPAAADATLAISRLGGAYARLAILMQEAAASSPAFAVPGAAFAGAGRRRSVRRNRGGTIPGSGNTDTVPAMLTPGEFVINKQATAQNLPLLQAINNGYNKGGYVQYFARNMSQRIVQARKKVPFQDEISVLEAMNAENVAAAAKFGGLRRVGLYERVTSAAERALSPTIKLQELRGKTIKTKKTLERMATNLTSQEQDLFEISTLGALVLRLPDGPLNQKLKGGMTGVDALKAIDNSGLTTAQIFEPIAYQINGFLQAKGAGINDLALDQVAAMAGIRKRLASAEGVIKDPDFSKIVRDSMMEAMSGNEVSNFMSRATMGRSFRIYKDKGLSNDEWADSLQNRLTDIRSTAKIVKKKDKDGKTRVWLEKDGQKYEITPNYETGHLDLGDGVLAYEQLRNRLKLPRGSGLALTHVNSGGQIPGTGNTDTVPAMLTPGEYVINKEATAANLPLLQAINDGQMSKFANGGYVYKPEPYVNADGASGMDYVVYDKKGRPVEIFSSGREAREFIKRRTLTGRVANAGRSVASGVRSAFVRPSGGMNPMGVSMGLGALGGAAMMAPMMPFIGQNEGLSNMAGMAGMGLSMASVIPMLNKAAGPVAILATAAAAAGASLYVMRKSIDDTAKEAAKVGASLGGAANRMEQVTKATGYQFAKDRVGMRSFRFTKEEAQKASEFSQYFESEAGQKMITDLKALSPEQRYKEVSSMISMAIADGMDEKTAKGYGDAIAFYASDAILKQRLFSDIKRGKFNKGSVAMIDLVRERQIAATTPIIAPPAMASSPISERLGTSGATNIFGEAAAVTGAMAGAGALAGSIIPGIGTAVGAVAGTLIGGTVAIFKAKSAMDELNKSMETVAVTFGSSIQILKELENAEALLLEERRKGRITQKEYVRRQKELDAMREAQAERLKEAVKVAVDVGATEQSITDQLTLSGFDAAVAGAVARSLSREDVAQKLFQKKYDELDDASKEVVGSVISNVLSGMTPENAQQKIGEIETIYAGMANELLGAAKDGLSQGEIDSKVLVKQLSNWANSIFADIDAAGVGYTKRKSNYREEIAQNIAQNDEYFRSIGIGVDEVTSALSSFGNLDFAAKVALDEKKLKGFANLVVGLSDPKYKQIEIEIATKYMFDKGLTPDNLVKKIDAAAKKINKIDFKQFGKNFKEIENLAPDPMTFINFGMSIGKSIKDIPELYQQSLKGLDVITDDFKKNITKSGKVKITANLVTAINGDLAPNSAAITGKLQSMFPKGLPPIILPIILQIPNIAAGLGLLNKKGKAASLPAGARKLLEQGGASAVGQSVSLGAGAQSYQITAADLAAYQTEQTLGAADIFSQGLTPPTGGEKKGGGGAGQKSLFQQLMEGARAAMKMYRAVQDLMYNETKKGGVRFDKDFKKFIAGPFAPEFLEYLRSQGEEGLKIIKGGAAKVRKAYEAYTTEKLASLATQALYLPQTMRRERKNKELDLGMRRRLADEGRSGQQIEYIVERTRELRMAWQEAQNTLKQKLAIPKDKRTEQDKEAIKTAKEFMRVYRLRRQMIEDTAADDMELARQEAVQQSLQGLNDETKKSQTYLTYISQGILPDFASQLADIGEGELLTEEQKNKALQKIRAIWAATQDPLQLKLDIINLEEQKAQIEAEMEILSRVNTEFAGKMADAGVQSAEELLALLEDQSDQIARSIELKQRDIEAIDDQISLLEEQKTKINEAFDERLKALDEVEKANERIYALQQGQLNVAQSLSRGDVAGAAQAAMELQQTLAQQRNQETRDALEMARQKQLKAVDASINELKKQRKTIENEIKLLQLEQRAIQDQIYTVENRIKKITMEVNDKYNIGTQNLAKMKLEWQQIVNAIDEANKKLKTYNDATGGKETTDGGGAGTDSGSSGGSSGNGGTGGAIYYNQVEWKDGLLYMKGTATLANGWVYDTNNNRKRLANYGQWAGDWTPMMYGGIVAYKGSREQAPGFMMGGRIKKFATGSWVPGAGMTDKVPAMLTPGEFVVRKPVAQALGPALEALNGNVFPKMNLSGPGVGVKDGSGSSPVQYNYDINVNVAGSNASPDEIALAVMNKIKMTEDRSIRSYRY